MDPRRQGAAGLDFSPSSGRQTTAGRPVPAAESGNPPRGVPPANPGVIATSGAVPHRKATSLPRRPQHHDHLGSITALTSSTGGLVDRFSYDPWGKRRQAVTSPWLSILPGSHLIPASLANLTRGFTGHEHLDRVGLIHMNGRIYDPELGRFLSADPILQFPASTQGLDRYAYVLNNPVSLSDPSGHLVFGLAAALIGVKLAASGKFVLAALTAAIGGYLDTGSLKAGIFSAISAGFSFGVGTIGQALLDAGWKTAFQLAAVATLHGLTQGILAVAQGGKFGAGFLSAAASSVFGPKGSGAGISDGKRLVRILQAAAVGGTASRIGGGKFANGAVTGAFVQAFNDQLQHGAADNADQVYETREEARAAAYEKLPYGSRIRNEWGAVIVEADGGYRVGPAIEGGPSHVDYGSMIRTDDGTFMLVGDTPMRVVELAHTHPVGGNGSKFFSAPYQGDLGDAGLSRVLGIDVSMRHQGSLYIFKPTMKITQPSGAPEGTAKGATLCARNCF